MNSIADKLLIPILIIVAFIGMSSYIPLNGPDSNCNDNVDQVICDEIESPSKPLTSNGDILGFYTTLSISANPIQIEVVSFPAFSAGATTINGPWSPTINLPQSSLIMPTNTSAYNPILKELVCLVSGQQLLLKYEDMNMTAPSPINVFPTTATAPVFFNNTYFALDIENGGFGDLPLFEANIVSFDFQTGTFGSVMALQFVASPFSSFYHEIVSSATNITDEIYFLAGSNLIIATDLDIWAPNYCWIDLAPNNSPNNYFIFYGLEYKSPGVLMAIRETKTNISTTAIDLVEINFNSASCTVGNITVIYDMLNNFMPSPAGWVVNREFYSTTYDACRKMYYLSTQFNHSSDSRLVEIDVQNASHVEQILPEYLFGIEWKQMPCPCEANFAIQQFGNCSITNFVNASTGSAPMTCHWDFGDPNSGTNNTSVQCVERHQFSTCGTFNVCLIINANGCVDTTCQTITVTDFIPPVAICNNNVVVALDANCIAIPTIDEIDGGSFDGCKLTSLALSPGVFNNCGIYPITLTVTDWCGNTGACNTTITVIDNMPPRITCPSDVYLSTLNSNCSMIVNGLQWTGLSDNCAVATLTYTVTGASNHSGAGDASGLLFNAGTSFVTYTATDICGNTVSCSFKVVLECICICPSNLIQNPGFNVGVVVGSLSGAGQSNSWENGYNQQNLSANIGRGGCCDFYSGLIIFYAPSQGAMYGASIYQTGFSFSPLKHYKISLCGLAVNGVYPRLGVVATNTPVIGTLNPYNCTNCDIIGPGVPLPPLSNWESFTLPIWRPSTTSNTLFIRGFLNPGTQSQAYVDNICVEEVLYICCGDEQAFIENSDNAIISYVDFETREGVVEIGNLMECNSIDYIDWGDNTPILNGPILGNRTLRHAYAEAGTYEVQYQVREFDTQDTSQTACLDHIFIDEIIILPDTCFCGVFSSMAIRWDPDFTQEVSCGNDTVLLGCPSVGRGYDFSGIFYCNGTICPNQSEVSWMISGPSGNFSGTSIANPFFGVSILPSYISQPGVYSLSLSGNCGGQSCICTVNFVVDCPDLCPCGLPDIQALANAVNMGFSQATQSNACKACFSPNAISSCETVEWHIGTITPTPLTTTNGNQTFCYDFPNAGSYTIIMVVNRKKSNGDDCEAFTFSKEVNINCQNGPECNDPHFINPNFHQGSVGGGLNSGGATTGWLGTAGNPIVEEGVEESPDGWAIYLSGNADYQDILQTKEALCLDSDMGTLTLRAKACPCGNENERPRPRRCDIITADLINGMEIKRVASFPLTDLDSSVWWDFKFPFDLSEWTGIDSCSDNPSSNSVFLRISVSNAFGDNQGGPLNFTDIQIDNVCLDNLVFISNPTPVFPVKISPNPNDGGFVIDLPQPVRNNTTMRIISMTGQVLLEKLTVEGTKVQTMEASHLLSGMYFLQIVSDGRVMSVDKFVKM